MKDKKRALLYLCILLTFIIISLVIFLSIIEPRFYMITTGRAIDSEEEQKQIHIQSPENITYFLKDKDEQFIELNVSANFQATSWKYDLVNTMTGEIVAKDVIFTSGDKIGVLRWNNRITVKASDESGNIIEKSVEFSVSSKDSFPLIKNLDSTIYACEGETLRYNLTVQDPDENMNPGPIEIRIDPLGVFYVTPDKKWPSGGDSEIGFQIASKKLTKEDAGGTDKGSKTYDRKISVNDGRYYSSNETKMIVIEKNNPPDIDIIGVRTEIVDLKKEKEVHYKLNVLDIEDGNQDSGNLKFNMSFVDISLFEINSNGLMSLKFDKSNIGVYNITVCVKDTGIEIPHEKIKEVCNQDGSDQTSCSRFSITITETNYPPTITDYYPKETELNGNKRTKFNVTIFDPDKNAPDVYWYVDGELVKYASGIDLAGGFSEFEYDFSCESQHLVKARTTDGLMNDSIEWKIMMDGCISKCPEKWACGQWKVCQNLNTSFASGILSEEDYRDIKDECTANKWEDENCGFQIRECLDISECNTSSLIPEKVRRCFYTMNPNCEDSIANCHSRDCEILVDCGGPCKECPTCYDGKQNQGEEGIDCGGPCYTGCMVKETPIYIKNPLRYFLITVIIGLLIIIGFKIISISKIRKEIEREANSYL